jgi:leader peptidase (prepilin peptidase)/N-methyltransferase
VGLALGLINAAVQVPDGSLLAVAIAIVQAILLALMFLALRHAYALIRKRQGLGLGDVKLAAVAGAWLDWPLIPVAIQIAAFAALTMFLARHFLLGRGITATQRIPFGTFLAPAIWIAWLIGVLLLQI